MKKIREYIKNKNLFGDVKMEYKLRYQNDYLNYGILIVWSLISVFLPKFFPIIDKIYFGYILSGLLLYILFNWNNE